MCLETKHWLKLVFFRPKIGRKKGRKPKNKKKHLSKENVWFQLQKMVFWFSLGFFCFFGFSIVFFGFFNFLTSKNQKNSRKKMVFLKMRSRKPSFSQVFFWFLNHLLIHVLTKTIFSLEFFLVFE